MPSPERSLVGTFRGSILGNDAVIVARELSEHGIEVKCWLLDPTSSDVALVKSILPEDSVRGINEEDGALTQSLCIEDSSGRRSWTFSRRLRIEGDVESTDAALIYADYYPELVEFLNHTMVRFKADGCDTFLNFSALRDHSIPQLPFRPSVIQISADFADRIEDAMRFASRVAVETGAEIVFVTMGYRGAVCASSSKVFHFTEKASYQGSILGAGALFSSVVIRRMLDDIDFSELLESSVKETAVRLQSWRTSYENFRS